MPAAPATTRAARADASGSANDIADLKAELDSEPAVRWLQRITVLRREGRRADADALLAEFKRRFPEVRIPPAFE